MIVEMRTYRMKPGSIPEVENRFAEGLRERTKVSPLGAFFHTEVGPLNRIIHCWPYDDLAHRSKVRSHRYRGWMTKLMLGLLAVCFVWLGKIGAGPGTDPVETQIGRVLTFLYFAIFITMPVWTKLDKTKPLPERVTLHD